MNLDNAISILSFLLLSASSVHVFCKSTRIYNVGALFEVIHFFRLNLFGQLQLLPLPILFFRIDMSHGAPAAPYPPNQTTNGALS